jgi:hypothetical protein
MQATENEHDGQPGTGNLSFRPDRICGLWLSGYAGSEKEAYTGPSEGLSVDKSSAADELAGLRHFLKGLESGDMKLTVNGVDGTQHEIDILKHEIVRLGRVIARFKSGGPDA